MRRVACFYPKTLSFLPIAERLPDKKPARFYSGGVFIAGLEPQRASASVLGPWRAELNPNLANPFERDCVDAVATRGARLLCSHVIHRLNCRG
jgi:hypothetical protein